MCSVGAQQIFVKGLSKQVTLECLGEKQLHGVARGWTLESEEVILTLALSPSAMEGGGGTQSPHGRAPMQAATQEEHR